MKVKSILVSQPEPKADNSPYAQIIENHNVKVDFVPFVKIEGMTAKDRSHEIYSCNTNE